jgi:hypothetical protein
MASRASSRSSKTPTTVELLLLEEDMLMFFCSLRLYGLMSYGRPG